MEGMEDFEKIWLQNTSNALDEMLTSLDPQGAFLLDEQQKRLVDIKDKISKEIESWNFLKLRAQVGWPVPPPLDYLQPICEKVVLVFLKQLEQYSVFCQPELIVEEMRCYLKQMYLKTKILLSTFIRSCLVIESKLEQVVVKSTKYVDVSLRLLLGKSCLHPAPTDVTCCLYFENEINFNEEGYLKSSVDGSNNEIHKVPFKESKGVYRAHLRELIKIPGKSKKTESNSSSLTVQEKAYVGDQKSCFVFTTELVFLGQNFTIQAITVPFVLLSKKSYAKPKAESLIFWDNAFATKGRKLFDVPNAVSVNDFLEALNYYWSLNVGAGLTTQHLSHIISKFFVFPEFCNNPNQVTKAMFNQLIMSQKKDVMSHFPFWTWFSEILNFVKEKLKQEWNNGYIEGFIARDRAENLLQDKPVGTFLLRFSDTSLPSAVGGISVTCKEYQSADGCRSVEPWTKADLAKNSLSFYLKEKSQCRFLYPSLKEKESVFIPEKKRTHPGYPRKKKVCTESDFSSPVSSVSDSVASPGSNISMGSPTSSSMALIGHSTTEQPFWPQMSPNQDFLNNDPFMGNTPMECTYDNRKNWTLQI